MPRSLVPLADESLPGFLLRLAHRLDLAPWQLFRRTGLVDAPSQASAPVGRLLMLDTRRRAAFCESTRMTPAAAESLTLLSFLERYPPLARTLVRDGNPPRPRSNFPSWLLTTYSRFCPLCLTGDGSPIQDQHGGPWKRQWRLATTFACLRHDVFLQLDCPACRLPAHSGVPGGQLRLLPAPGVAKLHPAQCRNRPTGAPRGRICGFRLDQAEPLALPLSQTLASLQHRLDERLAAGHPAGLVFQWIADLQVASALVRATWPAGETITPPEGRSILAQQVAIQEKLASTARPGLHLPTRRGQETAISWSVLPPEAPAAAAVLAAADTLISEAHHNQPQHSLTGLLSVAPPQDEPRWGEVWRTLARDSSPMLRQRITPNFRLSFPSSWVLQGARRQWAEPLTRAEALVESVIEVKDRGFAAEHVPQFLPDAWFRIFTGDSGMFQPSDRPLRRAVAVHMVQSVTGQSFGEAAGLLGVPSTWITQRRRLQPHRLHSRWQNYDFIEALERLAQYLSQHAPLTDFQARRAQFADWRLDDNTWETLVELVPKRRGRRPGKPTRDCASALVWNRLTGSEYLLAPVFHPPLAETPRPTEPHLLGIWDRRYRRNSSTPFPELLDVLEALSTELIDAQNAHDL